MVVVRLAACVAAHSWVTAVNIVDTDMGLVVYVGDGVGGLVILERSSLLAPSSMAAAASASPAYPKLISQSKVRT